mgnify:FL=1|nr:MAG TPA: protein of unknown function DUF4376 [Caudoviricetes sp.]
MQMLEISALFNGAHSNQTYHGFLPSGWAVIPDDMTLEAFPFGEVEAAVDEETGLMTVTKWAPGMMPELDIKNVLQEKITNLSNACNQAITSGMDVETTEGIEHFSLEETDQINLTAALSAIEQGAKGYPYHADKKLCRMFTAVELKAIAKKATAHKLYHTTLCNHLLILARRATTTAELDKITYSADCLPLDLAQNMKKILVAAGITE